MGQGTFKIIQTCKETSLTEPEIIEQDGGTSVTLFKGHYTEEQMQKLGLNERQIKAVLFVRDTGNITNSKYQELSGTSKPTATRDLKELEAKKILTHKGTKGSSSKYELA